MLGITGPAVIIPGVQSCPKELVTIITSIMMTSIIDERFLSAVMLNSPIARMLRFLFRFINIVYQTSRSSLPHEKIKFKFPASSLLGVVRLHVYVYVWVLQPRLQLQQLCMCMSQDLLLLAGEEVERTVV